MSIKGEPKLPDGTGDLLTTLRAGFDLIRTAKGSRDSGISSFLVFHLPDEKAVLESWITYWIGHCGEREGVDFFLDRDHGRVKIYRASYEARV